MKGPVAAMMTAMAAIKLSGVTPAGDIYFSAVVDEEEKGLGVDMGHWNQDLRREDGFGFTQDQHDAMYVKLAQPLVTVYQCKVRDAINPKHLCGSYYRTLTPEKYTAHVAGKER